jgi:hypothetical protein
MSKQKPAELGSGKNRGGTPESDPAQFPKPVEAPKGAPDVK